MTIESNARPIVEAATSTDLGKVVNDYFKKNPMAARGIMLVMIAALFGALKKLGRGRRTKV